LTNIEWAIAKLRKIFNLRFCYVIMTDLKLGKYQHYKGKFYEVICVARHSETLEELVIYRALYESKRFGMNSLWARPKSMFLENVNIGGKEVPRFRYVG